jgi:hypothetical protein
LKLKAKRISLGIPPQAIPDCTMDWQTRAGL